MMPGTTSSNGFTGEQRNHSPLHNCLSDLYSGLFRPGSGMSAYDIFFGFLHGMQFAIGKVTSSAALDTLKNTQVLHKYICQDVVGYVCYDLAAQNYDRHLIYHPCSHSSVSICYGPKRLMRLILFSFAYMLSARQRKAIIDSLSSKLLESSVELYGHEEYFQLLNMVDNLQSSSSPNTCDSRFMYVIESSVDLLVNMVSGNKKVTGEKISILMMILETRFLLRTASCAYETLIARAQADNLSFTRDYLNMIKDILRADITLRKTIDYVCDYSVLDNVAKNRGMLLCRSALHKIHSCYDNAALGYLSPPIEYIGVIFKQAENIQRVYTKLLDAMISNKKIALDTSAWMYYEMSKLFPEDGQSSSKHVVWICLHDNKQIVCEAYRLVANGASAVLVALQKDEAWNKRPLPIRQITSMAPVLCSRVVAHHTKDFLWDVWERGSRRVHSTVAAESMGEVYFMLLELCLRSVSRDRSSGNFFARSQAHEKVFRNLQANIFINISLGDTRHLLEESAEAINLNFRVFALYINMFCNLTPDMMNEARIKLRETLDKRGIKLPNGVNDMLCILTDLKAFSYKSTYTGSDSDYAHDVENVYTRYYKNHKRIAVNILETSTMLLVHSASVKEIDSAHCSRYSTPSCVCSTVDWLSVLRMLLYECQLLCATSSVLSRKVASSSQNGSLLLFSNNAKSVHHEVSTTLTGEKLRTVDKFAENKAETKSVLHESMKKISELLGKNFGIEKKDTETSIEELYAMSGALYDSVCNTGIQATSEIEETDTRLIAYMLCRSYVSIRHAFDIVDSMQQGNRTLDSEPSLGNILREYFLCDKIGSSMTINTPTMEKSDAESADTLPGPSAVHSEHVMRFEAEGVSNSLDDVEINHAPSYPPLLLRRPT